MVDQDNSTAAGNGSPRQRAIEAYDGARERATDTLGKPHCSRLPAGSLPAR